MWCIPICGDVVGPAAPRSGCPRSYSAPRQVRARVRVRVRVGVKVGVGVRGGVTSYLRTL